MLWKGLIEEVMEDLLLFIEPNIAKELDLERGFTFLDKELAEMYPEPGKATGARVVDKLVKAWLRDGTERWMLLHVEIQGKNDKQFPRRMFEYFVRLFGKYGQPVAAIAVLTGKDGKKAAGVYEDKCLWMRARYEYKTLSIADYPDEVLEASSNPFAAVLLVAKEALATGKGSDAEKDGALLEKKLLIVKLLKERMAIYGRKKTAAILAFLSNYVVFRKPETNCRFVQKADEIFGKKNTMGIHEVLAEIKYQEGLEEGMKEGIKKGTKRGLERWKAKLVRSLLAKTKFSPKKIADLAGVSVLFVNKMKDKVSVK